MNISKINPYISFSSNNNDSCKKESSYDTLSKIPSYDECYDPEKKELHIRVPVDSNSYSSTCSKKEKSDYEIVIIKKGKAYHTDGRPFDGSVLFKDKKDNLLEFGYENGELSYSYKNNNPVKFYSNIPSSMIYDYPEFSFYQNFSDGTNLEEDQYYDTHSKYKVISRNNKSSVFIKRNESAQYADEPILRVVSDNQIFTVLNAEGSEKVLFKSKEEAEKYFKEEYGIEAEFINLKQAHLLKNAVDDFAALDYRGKGKKIFDGVKIGIFSDKSNKIGHVEYLGDIKPVKEEDSFLEKMFDGDIESNYRKLKEIYPEKTTFDYLVNNLSIIPYSVKIEFNDNFNWDNIEDSARESDNMYFHPTSEAKNYIIHELAHFLHYQNSPSLSFIAKFPFFAGEEQQSEKNTAADISYYSSTDMTEFVAEYITGRICGKEYSSEADALYKKYGGPDLFKD